MGCAPVQINYKKLWKLLIDKDMSATDLERATGIAPSTFSKMRKNKLVALDVLIRICAVLKCQLSDITEVEEVCAKNLSASVEA